MSIDQPENSADRLDKITCMKRGIEAMREFCKRVEDGEVSSRYTYAKFKAILEDYDRS